MRTTMAVIRLADEADAGAMLAIYAPYVRETAISFETEPPSEEEFRQRVRSTLEVGPWLLVRWAVPPASRVPVDRRGDGVRACRTPPQGRRPRPLHRAPRLPRAAGFPERGRRHRAPQPGERGAPRAGGLRASRGAARGRLQARALARRRLVAARARRAGPVARAAALAGGGTRGRAVAPRPRGRCRAGARVGLAAAGRRR